LLLLIVGALFLWRNLHPETPVFDLLSQYWPFLLIGWGLLRLVEVAVWRERRTGGFTGGEVVLVVLICAAGSLIWAARANGIHVDTRGLNWWGSSYDYQVDGTAPLGGAKRIVFENARGNIKVTGADTTGVTVTGHKSIRAYERSDADRANGNTPLEIVPQGDHLLIRTNQDHVSEKTWKSPCRALSPWKRTAAAITRSPTSRATWNWRRTAATCAWRAWTATRGWTSAIAT
jgi:hypothetical protein